MGACGRPATAGVREASGIITPILAAAFIGMIAILPLTVLQGKLGMPRWLALLIVLGATLGGALGIGYYLSQSAAALKPMLPEYQARIDDLLYSALEGLRNRGIDTLLVAGDTTEVCVHTTVRMGYFILAAWQPHHASCGAPAGLAIRAPAGMWRRAQNGTIVTAPATRLDPCLLNRRGQVVQPREQPCLSCATEPPIARG